MPNQVLIIEPQNELKFKVDYAGIFELSHTTYMQLTNPSEHTVLFKIKTTAPKKYCVRPNSGVLSPNSKVDIAITPQPVHVDNTEKHKHKFMVQSVIAPEGKTNIDQVWKEISPDQLMDYKLKCVFESPRGANQNDSGDTAAPTEIIKKRAPAEDAKLLTKDAEGPIQNEVKRKDDDHTPVSPNAKTEELLRVHQGGESRMPRGHSYGPEKTEQVALMPWIATAIGMALLGIIIGKFLM
ncbi:vesicle-associated membrane protein-associated protein A-like isoform X4 [Pararge aegeria]|uniref:vesicle-associated membrane protein-associated protein A-like isoform X4 n=1 Tax=Pararge aegeria TaxID=116150 RepID=UPI0019D070B2|nr:vesicle-associated membrane protein-associated protein A-like isoform X4 [Pararge aegeria]